MQNVMMSGGRKPVQEGVRVKLAAGVTWDALAAMSPDEIRQKGLLPPGFLPLPHVKHATGGQVFPDRQIDEIRRQEGRDLRRFDVNFDFPDHITAEFPPPIFLTTRPELGDVSRGQLLTIRNFYEIMNGIVTPVQMEGLRLLLTPFPQEEFNQTEDRKVAEQQRNPWNIVRGKPICKEATPILKTVHEPRHTGAGIQRSGSASSARARRFAADRNDATCTARRDGSQCPLRARLRAERDHRRLHHRLPPLLRLTVRAGSAMATGAFLPRRLVGEKRPSRKTNPHRSRSQRGACQVEPSAARLWSLRAATR